MCSLSHCGLYRPEVSLGYSKVQKSLILCEIIILTPVFSQNERQRKKMASWNVQVGRSEPAMAETKGSLPLLCQMSSKFSQDFFINFNWFVLPGNSANQMTLYNIVFDFSRTVFEELTRIKKTFSLKLVCGRELTTRESPRVMGVAMGKDQNLWSGERQKEKN